LKAPLSSVSLVEIRLANRLVGRLAWHQRRAHFEYDRDFLAAGIELSPFRLPLRAGVQEAPLEPFNGLHGVFNDSLPDGWGRLLIDRKLRLNGIQPEALTPLDRLAFVGSHGMGALTYHPQSQASTDDSAGVINLDQLAEDTRQVLIDDASAALEQLLRLGGSPQGARPKALIGVSQDRSRIVPGDDDLKAGFDHWLVKFRAPTDPEDVGAIEQAYAEMARLAGIDMPETYLFPAAQGPGHFAIKRFDRLGNQRIHMQTASGLLNADHRLPSLTYNDLLKLTRALTRDQKAVDQVFIRMAFNILAHNRDDHTKNHSFLMDANGEWTVSPGYDLTYSVGPGGEHSMAISGEGRRPTLDHILAAAKDGGIVESKVIEMIDKTAAAIRRWPDLAERHGVSPPTIASITDELDAIRRIVLPVLAPIGGRND
jgi:serine/threonine-protein kinase HipA